MLFSIQWGFEVYHIANSCLFEIYYAATPLITRDRAEVLGGRVSSQSACDSGLRVGCEARVDDQESFIAIFAFFLLSLKSEVL